MRMLHRLLAFIRIWTSSGQHKQKFSVPKRQERVTNETDERFTCHSKVNDNVMYSKINDNQSQCSAYVAYVNEIMDAADASKSLTQDKKHTRKVLECPEGCSIKVQRI